MKNLLKFEYSKLFKQKSFYVCTILILVFSTIGMLLSRALSKSLEMDFSPEYILLNAFSESNFTMISGIFLVLFVCTDFDNGTIKNIYSRGFSKTKVYFAKLIASFTAIIIMFVITLLFTLIISCILFTGTAEAGNYILLIFGQLILLLASSSFVIAITFLFKKIGPAITIAILGPILISTLLSLLDAFLKNNDLSFESYWLISIESDLTSLYTSTTRIGVCIALSLFYSLIFILAGWRFHEMKKD